MRTIRTRNAPAAGATLVAALLVAGCTATADPPGPLTTATGAGSDEEDVPPSVHRFRTTDLVAPVLPVTHGPAAPAEDDDALYVLGPKRSEAPKKGPLIVDAQGEPVWIAPEDVPAYDVRVQELDGERVITYYVGQSDFVGHGFGDIVVLDDTYTEVARVTTGGDVGPGQADMHDATITPDGTMLLLAYVAEPTDLTAVGGDADGWAWENVVQEVDVETGEVVFEWRASEHVDLTDTRTTPDADPDAPKGSEDDPFDWFHVNAATLAPDGDVIVSARNTHAVYRVDRSSGEIEWILGGTSSDFAMDGADDGTGAQFAWQHDAQLHDDGTLTLFDNQANPPVGDRSRGLRLDLDTDAMTASVAQEWLPTDPALLAGSQGNLQVLPGGNVVVGWGDAQLTSEFTADGTLVREMPIEAGESYRAYRALDWVGRPDDPPAVVVEGGTAYASWNGATQVASWRLVAGPSEADAETVAEVPRDGFETALAPVPEGAAYVAVEALDADGTVLGTGTPG
ncbi:arylsulfotransferase family protein [Cellulosimicrobium marinum]|uniref:arylsulfotransferase family protein n=1 Tax=Cellulosimicrobium marinum TaxID=1638992 RepID=UPI001E65DCF8|nr:arylsulfotransferase family protein [Cellulosimicrobium marinum]MCB7135675.1 arylsulfotransferase family protein [Cellulosimicrobium marinum]